MALDRPRPPSPPPEPPLPPEPDKERAPKDTSPLVKKRRRSWRERLRQLWPGPAPGEVGEYGLPRRRESFVPSRKKEQPKKRKEGKKDTSLFGEKERVVKMEKFRKWLRDPKHYYIDRLSPYKRRKEWTERFPETGTGYLERRKVEEELRRTQFTRPKTLEEIRRRNIKMKMLKKMLGK
ncbi:MAG: hypothetical protein ACE5WD_13180 [Candidatus Aminicenantia bacterium]